MEQQIVLRQLEAILSIHKLANTGNQLDALREVAKLPFLPLDPRAPDVSTDIFNNLSPHVQACVPDLLKVALHCLDNVTDTDGSLRALRAKVCFNFYADNSSKSIFIRGAFFYQFNSVLSFIRIFLTSLLLFA